MNYKEKYENGVECIQEILSGAADLIRTSTLRKRLQPFFPELKENESEDERIRKGLIKSVSRIFEGHKLYDTDVTREEALAWLEKQGEHLIGKIEPKFHPGDWVVLNGTVAQILDKQKYGFVGLDIDGKDFFCNYGHTDLMRLWTIQDANDGDVLVTPSEIGSESNEQIFLFKAINNRDYVDNCIEYYGCVYDGIFHKNKTGYMGTTLDTFYPATKEQRDLLFQAMKEDGYEWDSEKKELKKIEVKTLNADKVIEWLKNTINERAENYGVYRETRLILPYNSIEDLINDFKEDFGL